MNPVSVTSNFSAVSDSAAQNWLYENSRHSKRPAQSILHQMGEYEKKEGKIRRIVGMYGY